MKHTTQVVAFLLFLGTAFCIDASPSSTSTSPREITLKNHCIERKATLENADYLQGRIDRGEKLWQRTRKNLETARDGLRRHAQMLEEKIFTEGADYRMICQATKPLTETENALTEVNKDES